MDRRPPPLTLPCPTLPTSWERGRPARPCCGEGRCGRDARAPTGGGEGGRAAAMRSIPYERKRELVVSLGPLGNRHGSCDEQNVVVRARPIAGHDVLEMHAEELPSQTAVVLRREHVPERNAPGQRVASACADMEAHPPHRMQL